MKTLDPATLTRADKLNLIYRHTHRDYKGGKGPARSILVLRGAATSVPITDLTDAEIEDKLPYALKKETERLSFPGFTESERRLVKALGEDAAKRAHALNEEGEGPHMIAREFEITWHEANSLINAGRKFDAKSHL